MAFVNQVILITGAGSGIGRQLARTLAGEGAVIAGVDLQAESLNSLSKELEGHRCAWAVADVIDVNAMRATVKHLEAQLGPIDILIANAGIGRETSALSFRAEDVEAQVRVNLLGVANSIDAVLPGMLRRRRGHLVAISSLASYRGLPRMAGYCATKAGVNALMEGLRIELKPFGIDTTIICPGWVRTPLTTNINVPQPDMLEVDDAVRRIVGAIRRKRLFFAFPWRGVRKVQMLRWLPSGISDWIVTQYVRRLQPPRS